jgi:hypothetical protein
VGQPVGLPATGRSVFQAHPRFLGRARPALTLGPDSRPAEPKPVERPPLELLGALDLDRPSPLGPVDLVDLDPARRAKEPRDRSPGALRLDALDAATRP